MNIEIILGAATLMVLAHQTPIYHRVLRLLHLDRKPFNCVMCSTFWTTLIFTSVTMNLESIFINIIHASTAALLAELIDIQLKKI